jgi:hypothetical protein
MPLGQLFDDVCAANGYGASNKFWLGRGKRVSR